MKRALAPVPSTLPIGAGPPATVVTTPGRDDDLPDRVVAAVGDVEVARAVEGDADGSGKAGGRARPVGVAVQTPTAQAGDGGDGSGRDDDLPDGVAAGVADVEVARPVAGDAAWRGEAGGGARPVGAAGSGPAAPAKRGDGPVAMTIFRMVLLLVSAT